MMHALELLRLAKRHVLEQGSVSQSVENKKYEISYYLGERGLTKANISKFSSFSSLAVVISPRYMHVFQFSFPTHTHIYGQNSCTNI